MVPFPTFDYEQDFWQKGMGTIGIDEVGYGALAGPLYVGFIYLSPVMTVNERDFWIHSSIHDSKLLQPKTRNMLLEPILQAAHAFAVVEADVNHINKYGIVNARRQSVAMGIKIIRQLIMNGNNQAILTDAFAVDNISGKNQANLIKGDQKSLSIAAASIIAKVLRDRYMEQLNNSFPEYGWIQNKGYGTLIHRQALVKYGKTPHHRDLYIRNITQTL